jgi:histidinol-phosphate phosphatase family protein
MTIVQAIWPQAEIEGRLYRRPTQAVILAGGRGTRMQPLTNHLPKPMVPVCGRPFLEYQIEQLADQGIERVLLLLGYLPEVVQRHFRDGRDWGVQIDYHVTDPDQLTCSRIAGARHLLDPCFVLLYCDNYWPMQMDRLWRRFCEARKPAMVTVYSNRDSYSRGCVAIDENQDVLAFDRTRTALGLREVEISYAIITDTCLELLPEEECLFEEAIYTPLARQGRLAAHVSDHRYYSVGSLNRLPDTELFFQRRPTIFLDRDGVLNRKPPRAHYVRNWTDWEWNPGALQALQILRHAGYRTVIVSNQAGIGRGLMTDDDLRAVHDRMRQEVAQASGRIDDIYYCPHDWDAGCSCRKPKSGLLFQAQKELYLDLTRTPFVGDDDRDAMAAASAGCPFYQVNETASLLDITRQLIT